MMLHNSHVQYEHIVVSGLPAQRGKQYGQKAAEKIRKNVAHYLQPGQLPPWVDVVRYIRSIYIPGLKQYFPSALEEMDGIAAGAGVSLEEIIMVNARYDLSRAPGGSRHRPHPDGSGEAGTNRSARCDSDFSDDMNECTSAAFLQPTTSEGNVITAQNWDISSYLYNEDLVILLEIHPDPSEGKPNLFVVTEAGQMGRSGMNSAGLGLCANALNTSRDYFPSLDDPNPTPTLPISLLRRLYLESKSYPQAVQAICNAPRHLSGNLILTTAEGFTMCLELTPDEVFVVLPEKDESFLIHSNHFLHPAMKSRARSDIFDTYPGGSSWYRNIRFREGVKPHVNQGINERVLKRAFSDHLGYPQALCQHVDRSGGTGLPGYPFKGSMTVACVMYDLTRKVITTCKGTPCTGIFETYRLSA
ncbi:putative Peptidase C45 hydrolase domain-containing protein [Seiridium cardinale]|uniref:Peptidase C45 hydrolase domain-containing protein n=1 Tax=Seiridium cardinale TaxID=138064 RepID=A0ABR2XQP0_9PEZI